MGVDVDLDGLRANARNADTCPYVFAEARHPEARDPLSSLRELVAGANARANAGLTDGDGLAPQGDRPAPGPRGPRGDVFYDGDVERTLGWFQVLAELLTGAGWTGRLEAIPWPAATPTRPGPGTPMTAVLALSGWGQRRPNGAAFPVWRRGPEPAEDLASLAHDWVCGVPGRARFAVVGPPVDASESDLRTLLETTLADQQARPFLEASTSDDRAGWRGARFGSQGHVLLSSREPGAGLAHQLATTIAAVLPWAERCDYAFVAGAEPDLEVARAERGRERLVDYYIGLRHLDQERLPDAFAWQLVTGRHLANARDLSGWRIEKVADDRYALAHPEPESWFLPDPDHPDWTRVEPGVLAQARADFGGLILAEPVPRQR